MIRTLTAFLILFALSAQAALNETFVIITNSPTTNGMTLVVNGNTRTWTNAITSSPSTLILTNSTIGGCATNLFNHVAATKFSGLNVYYSGTNGIRLQGISTITASLAGNWGYISNANSTTTAGDFVPTPFSNISSAATRTNIGSLLTLDLGNYSTNTFPDGATIVSTLFRLATNNNIEGSNVFGGTNLFSHISNVFYGTFNGIAGNITNGAFTTPYFVGSLMYRTNATGQTTNSTQVGAANIVRNFYEFAGVKTWTFSFTSNQHRLSGVNANYITINENTTNVDWAAPGGFNILAGRLDAQAGMNSTTGAFSGNVEIAGSLSALLGVTNALLTGTNNFRGDVAYQVTNNASLANGNNANLDFAGKIYSRISGPTAAFSINGIAGGRDGRLLILQNISGHNVTIANDSGVDPVAANRILTGTASDVTFTNASQPIWLLYDPTQSRWILQNMVGSASVGLTAVSNVGGGFAIFDSNAGSVAQLRTDLAGNGITISTNATNKIIRLANAIDIGTNTSFEIPNSAAPTTAVFGEIAGDNNAWAASRGAVQFYDGTANTYLVGALASDTPANGQVPKWNTGGTITWEDDNDSGGAGSAFTVTSTNVVVSTNMASPALSTLYTNGAKLSLLSINGTIELSDSSPLGDLQFIVINGGITTTQAIAATFGVDSGTLVVPWSHSRLLSPGAIWRVLSVNPGVSSTITSAIYDQFSP